MRADGDRCRMDALNVELAKERRKILIQLNEVYERCLQEESTQNEWKSPPDGVMESIRGVTSKRRKVVVSATHLDSPSSSSAEPLRWLGSVTLQVYAWCMVRFQRRDSVT